MTVENLPAITKITGVTGYGPFSINMDIADVNDLVVYRNDDQTTQYFVDLEARTISLAPSNTPLTVDDVVTVIVNNPIGQDKEFPRGGVLKADRIEAAYDNLVRICQTLNARAERIVKSEGPEGIVIKPLQANKLLVVDEDGVLGFSRNSIYELDDFLGQINQIPGGIDGLTTNADINTVAGIISSVSILAGLTGTVTAVEGNLSNIQAVLAIKDLIDNVARQAAEISAVAATGLLKDPKNYIWDPDLKFPWNRVSSYLVAPTTNNITRYWPISQGACMWRDGAFNYDVLPRTDDAQKNKVRVVREFGTQSSVSIFFTLGEIEATSLRDKDVTFGFTYTAGSGFVGEVQASLVKLLSAGTSTVNTLGYGTYDTNNPLNGRFTTSQTFLSNGTAYSLSGGESSNLVENFTIDRDIDSLTVGLTLTYTSTTQNADEWIEFQDFWFVEGARTEKPEFFGNDRGEQAIKISPTQYKSRPNNVNLDQVILGSDLDSPGLTLTQVKTGSTDDRPSLIFASDELLNPYYNSYAMRRASVLPTDLSNDEEMRYSLQTNTPGNETVYNPFGEYAVDLNQSSIFGVSNSTNSIFLRMVAGDHSDAGQVVKCHYTLLRY